MPPPTPNKKPSTNTTPNKKPSASTKPNNKPSTNKKKMPTQDMDQKKTTQDMDQKKPSSQTTCETSGVWTKKWDTSFIDTQFGQEFVWEVIDIAWDQSKGIFEEKWERTALEGHLEDLRSVRPKHDLSD